ncbi:MAG: hypothetical protein ACOY0T_28995 [Myxococcota bacterium]
MGSNASPRGAGGQRVTVHSDTPKGERVSGDGRTYDGYMRDGYGHYYDAVNGSKP